jgi:hypothetical protein
MCTSLNCHRKHSKENTRWIDHRKHSIENTAKPMVEIVLTRRARVRYVLKGCIHCRMRGKMTTSSWPWQAPLWSELQKLLSRRCQVSCDWRSQIALDQSLGSCPCQVSHIWVWQCPCEWELLWSQDQESEWSHCQLCEVVIEWELL